VLCVRDDVGEMMDEMEAGRLKAETFHFK
jgi:hypothetical protein